MESVTSPAGGSRLTLPAVPRGAGPPGELPSYRSATVRPTEKGSSSCTPLQSSPTSTPTSHTLP